MIVISFNRSFNPFRVCDIHVHPQQTPSKWPMYVIVGMLNKKCAFFSYMLPKRVKFLNFLAPMALLFFFTLHYSQVPTTACASDPVRARGGFSSVLHALLASRVRENDALFVLLPLLLRPPNFLLSPMNKPRACNNPNNLFVTLLTSTPF